MGAFKKKQIIAIIQWVGKSSQSDAQQCWMTPNVFHSNIVQLNSRKSVVWKQLEILFIKQATILKQYYWLPIWDPWLQKCGCDRLHELNPEVAEIAYHDKRTYKIYQWERMFAQFFRTFPKDKESYKNEESKDCCV